MPGTEQSLSMKCFARLVMTTYSDDDGPYSPAIKNSFVVVESIIYCILALSRLVMQDALVSSTLP
jgi:hypothetical protein